MKISGLFTLLTLALSVLTTPAFAKGRETVSPRKIPAGTIVVIESERALYYVYAQGRAIRYPVAVPKAGKKWTGGARIASKHLRPAWSAPAEVRRDNPNLPDVIPSGHPSNPMGEAALVLDRDEYAIHGTNQKSRASIGTSASYGCIRMYNEDVLDLYARVSVGTPVYMFP